MNQENWDQLCRNIYENKCILFLGSEFPIEIEQDGNRTNTTYSRLLSEIILDKINEIKRRQLQDLRQFSTAEIDQIISSSRLKYTNSELSELANLYIKLKGDVDTVHLNESIRNYLVEVQDRITSSYFKRLIQLPSFSFIVDTNYGSSFYTDLLEDYPAGESGFYHYKGDKKITQETSSGNIGTPDEPFVYNLYGSLMTPSSIAISEFDLIEWLSNVISESPPLPKNIKTQLSKPDICFLFMGFGFVTKSWHFKMLLYTLGFRNKSPMSFVLECLRNIEDDEDPTLIFFRDGLKTSMYQFDQRQFIEELIIRYNRFIEIQNRIQGIARTSGHPKVFISYKSEDVERATYIHDKLKEYGVYPWLDKKRLRNEWEEAIANEIVNSDAFLLLQSESMKRNRVSYVGVEVNYAVKQSLRYPVSSNFIKPVFIDSVQSVLDDVPALNAIQSLPLLTDEQIKDLAKEIKRTYEKLL